MKPSSASDISQLPDPHFRPAALEQLKILHEQNEGLQKKADALQEKTDVLQQQTGELQEKADALQQKTDELQEKTEALDHLNQQLRAELAYYKRMCFGKKTEQLPENLRQPLEEEIGANIAQIQEMAEQITPADPEVKKERQKSKPLPPQLPRVEKRIEPKTTSCETCGHELHFVREERSSQIAVKPAQFFIQEEIRPIYACRCCEQIVCTPKPPKLLEQSMASDSLIAWIITGKFLDHLPLYRLEQIAARSGVTLPRSSMVDWIGRTAVHLQPILDRLKEKLLQQAVLHADETPVSGLDPKANKLKKCYLWAYRSSHLGSQTPIVVFDYQASRAGKHAQAFLSNWAGYLMVDDYVGYKALFEQESIQELGCLAHVRRKFFELYEAGKSEMAGEMLKHIQELYKLESNTYSVVERYEIRQSKAKPILETFAERLRHWHERLCPGSAGAKAVSYALKRLPAVERYLSRGNLPIDNNPVENAIRPVALGRKNWLFIGSERGGQRLALLYSLLETAKLNGLNPAQWLEDVLEKLPYWPNSRLDELLPLRQNDGVNND